MYLGVRGKNIKAGFADKETSNFYQLIMKDFINYKRYKKSPVNVLDWKYTLLEKLEDFMDDTIDLVIKEMK